MEAPTSISEAVAMCYGAMADMAAEAVIRGNLNEEGERWNEMHLRFMRGYAYLNRHDPAALGEIDAAHRRYAFVRDVLRGARTIA